MASIREFDDRPWDNWHLTDRNVPVAGRFELHNGSGRSLAEMHASAIAVQGLISRAFAQRRRLRAHGATWSFSEAASIPGGWPLATSPANMLFRVPPGDVPAGFAGDPTGLFLCQTGVSVSELNQKIEKAGRSLATSGASNGQTFVGAMSTGTHGSAVDQPGIQGHVRAIQLIPAPDRNLWIEPASNRVTDGRIAADLGATVVADDALFNAALVSLGALGVIHAVVVETVPRFLLETHRARVPLTPELSAAMAGGDFTAADLPGAASSGGVRRPYFFQSVANDHIDRGWAYVTSSYRRDWDPGHKLVYDVISRRAPGYNLAVIVANLLAAAPTLTKPITRAVLSDQLSPIDGRVLSWGQSFNYSTPRAGTAGASVAVAAAHVHEVLAIFQAALKKVGQAPVAFACRYAQVSPGLLAFIRQPGLNAIVDIDGIDTRPTREVMAQAVLGLRRAGIPHAEHWGKLNQCTAASVRDCYGNDLDRWLAVRTGLLDREGEYVFGSPWLDRLGLTSPNF
jgi:FAD/FMN-containing dehydrogenase